VTFIRHLTVEVNQNGTERRVRQKGETNELVGALSSALNGQLQVTYIQSNFQSVRNDKVTPLHTFVTERNGQLGVCCHGVMRDCFQHKNAKPEWRDCEACTYRNCERRSDDPIGTPIVPGRRASLSAHESESMLGTYLVCREKQEKERETSKRHAGEAHSVLKTAILLPQRLSCY
jgi:hypothetical protein